MDLPDLARSRAILIGNGTYAEHPCIPDLPGAQACVQAMNALLTGPLCGWPTERITFLVDLAVPSELAVRVWEAVRDAEDVLLVYYVGHGMRTFDGQLALALADTRPHPETLRHTAMLYPELASILRGARAPTKLVILDCCHAELGHRGNYVFQSADLAEAYPVDGLYFIGASARDAKAKAPADGGLTYFTDAFVTTVTTGIPRQPPTLRLDQIFLELRARLLRANLPEPVEAGTRGAHQFPFARNAAPPEPIDDDDADIIRLRHEKTETAPQPEPPPTLQVPPVRPRRLAASYVGGLLVAAGCFIAANFLPLGEVSAYTSSGIQVAHVTHTFNLIHPFMRAIATGPDAAQVYISQWIAPLFGLGTAVSLTLAVLFPLLLRSADPVDLKARTQSAYRLSLAWEIVFAFLLAFFTVLSWINVPDNPDNPADNLYDRATVQFGAWLLFAASCMAAITLQQTGKRFGLPWATKPRQRRPQNRNRPSR